MGVAPRKVFVSHTSEFSAYPAARTFIDAARDAVLKAGDIPVEMSQFSARAEAPASYCERQVIESDIYVGIIGFRYGSPVVDRPNVSYTELEYVTARANDIPTLIFMLGEHALVPVGTFADLVHPARQASFRQSLLGSGIICATFETPSDLGGLIYQALTELRAATVAQPPERPRGRIWMVPPVTVPPVPRDLQTRELLSLLGQREPGRVAITTALRGAGGFGKTTLAVATCLESEIGARFPDGVLWVTVGEETAAGRLAEKLNDLSEMISGTRPTLSDPDVAGFRLGEIIGSKRFLIVVDDVWTRSQLRPFLNGAENCARLITTRVSSILPTDSVSVVVGAMTDDEALALLSRGLPELPMHIAHRLFARTGRWPVLLSLVNKALRRYVAAGESAAVAGERIDERLRTKGPTALDVRRAEDRADAVAATVEASLDSLSGDDLARFLELAVFPEDQDIPASTVRTFWSATGDLSALETDLLCEDLVDLSLALPAATGPGVRLHDVIRDYLRTRVGAAGLTALNGQLLAAVIAEATGRVDGAGDRMRPWWRLPADDTYMWRNLGYHLPEADATQEFEELCGHLRYLTEKLKVLGPVAVEEDLARATSPEARALHRAIGRSAHLLTGTSPEHALTSVFLSRLERTPDLESRISAFESGLAVPRLRPAWPLADLPHAALRRTLTGHTSGIWACAASQDGQLLASTGGDGVVRIWDVRTGHVLHVFTDGAGKGMNWACPIDPLGRWVASAGDDATIIVRSLRREGDVTRRMTGHTGAVRAAAVSPRGDWLASAGADRLVRVWDVASGTVRLTLTGHTGWIRACAAGPDGSWLATGGDDGTVRLWHVGDGSLLRTLRGHTGPVRALAIDPRGRWLASGGADGSARVWDVESGEMRLLLNGHSGWIRTCAAAADGTWLATAGDDRTVRVWGIDGEVTGLRAELLGHRGAIWASAAGSDGGEAWLATADVDGKVLLWDPARFDRPPPESGGPSGAVKACAVDPGGQWMVGAGEDRRTRLWDLATGAFLGALPAERKTVRACAVSPDARLVATADDNHLVQIWDATNRTPVATLAGHAAPVRTCVFNPDSTRLASGSDDHTVKVWDVSAGTLLETLTGHTGAVRACVYGPDGQWIASAGGDRTVRLWNTDDGSERAVLRGHSGYVRALCPGPGDHTLVSVGDDRLVRIWDLRTGTQSAAFEGHSGAIWACAFDRNTGLIATAGDDPEVRLWDPATGPPSTVLGRHTSGVRTMATSSAGLLVTSGGDESVRVWDVAQRRLRAVIETDVSHWRACAVSADGRLIAAASSNGALRLQSGDGDTVRLIDAHDGATTDVAVDASGAWLLSSGDDGHVRRWDAHSGALLADFRGEARRSILATALSPDGSWIAAASSDGRVTVFDLEGRPVCDVRCHEGWARTCVFSPDSRFVVSTGDDGMLCFTELHGELTRYPSQHTGWVTACDMTREGGLIATGGQDRVIRLWRGEPPTVVTDLAGHAGTVRSVAFDATGRLLASVDDLGELRVWDVRDGGCLTMIRVAHPLRACAWFPDSKRVCAAGHGGVFTFDFIPGENGGAASSR
ncbi:NB-ARC domain-containing protein [Streptomyces sp. NPDC013178]|uniref:NB-ARC domain-containing protein n=1 Tax=Streptomyces sp. NPDC013178 TaxID=3155118 RepID=UPI0033F67203